MDERVVKFRVGVMVLATAFIAGILVLLFSDARTYVEGQYTIYIHFDDAPGVSEGTPIRKSGILIGRVKNVRFAEQGGVIVEAGIDRNVKLFTNEQPQVSGSLLGGDVVIQFVRRNHAEPVQRGPTAEPTSQALANNPFRLAALQPVQPQPQQPVEQIKSGDYVEGTVAPNALQVITNLEGDLSTAIHSLGTAGEEVARLAGYFNRLLSDNDQQISRIVAKTEETLIVMSRALAGAEDLIGNEEFRDNLKQTIAELPTLLGEAKNTMTTLKGTVDSMDRNLRNLEGLTGPLGERGDQLVDNVERAAARLDDLLGNLSNFSSRLNRGEGTLNKLLEDPDLYKNLNKVLVNVECLTRDLKPILADARVFTDKIARHPELLGVRGAIQNNPGTK